MVHKTEMSSLFWQQAVRIQHELLFVNVSRETFTSDILDKCSPNDAGRFFEEVGTCVHDLEARDLELLH